MSDDSVTKDSTLSQDEDDIAKEEQYLEDFEDDSSEFIENPISSPVVRSKYTSNTTVTPLKTNSIRSPTSSSSSKRRSLFEVREKRNSRLFNNHAEDSRMLNDTLNIDNNLDILDFDQSILPTLDYSLRSWNNQFSSNASSEIETLKKKVTGYQLQIRLIMDFLQKNGTNDLLHKLESENFSLVTCNKCDEKDKEKMNLKEDLVTYQGKYETTERQLRLYQDQLNVTNNQLTTIMEILDSSEGMMDRILDLLETQSSNEMRSKIAHSREHDFDVKLAVILMATKELLTHNLLQTTELQNVDAVRYMEENLKNIQQNFDDSQSQLASIEKQLGDSIIESKSLTESYNSLRDAFNKQRGTIAKLKDLNNSKNDKIKSLNVAIGGMTDSNESLDVNSFTQKLYDAETDPEYKLKELNEALLQKIALLEDEKFSLSEEVLAAQTKINELNKELSTTVSRYDTKMEELLTEVQNVQSELNKKDDQLRSLKQELSDTQVTSSFQLKENQSKINELSKELNSVVEKERTLTSEKFRLKHQLDSTLKDKKTLQINVDILKEKLATNSKSDEHDSFWNLKYEELLISDTKIVSKFLKIFEEILDSKSIEQARLKISELSNRSSFPRNQKRVKELHESIFHYYVSGIQAIIQDYLSLIKQLEEVEKEKNFKIMSLTNELNKLKQLKNHVTDENKDDSILKLRIDELTKKWKLERESRKSENDSLRKRLTELENENRHLKLKIQELTG